MDSIDLFQDGFLRGFLSTNGDCLVNVKENIFNFSPLDVQFTLFVFATRLKQKAAKNFSSLFAFLLFVILKTFYSCLLHDMKVFFFSSFILDYFVLSPVCAVIEYVRASRSRRKNIQLIFMIETSRNLMSGLILLCATIDIHNHVYKLDSTWFLKDNFRSMWMFSPFDVQNDFVVFSFSVRSFRDFLFSSGSTKAFLSLLSARFLRVFCGVGRYK